MFSIFQTEQTYGMLVYNTVLFCLITILFWKVYIEKYCCSKKEYGVIFAFIFLIYSVTACYSGDFWHYKVIVENYAPYMPHIIEDVYYMIMSFTRANYMSFRIVVWGLAQILTMLIFYRFGLDCYKTLFLFFCLFVSTFTYARVSLAMSVYFLGLSLILIPIKRVPIVNYIIGTLLLFLSISFHDSMIAVLALTPAIFLPLNKKWSITLLVIMIPIFAYLLKTLLFNIGMFVDDEEILRSATGYLEKESDIGSFTARVLYWWNFISFFLCFTYITLVMIKNRNIIIRKHIVCLYRLVVALFIFSWSCFFIDLDNTIFFYRYLFMTMIPLTILFALFRRMRYISQKQFSTIAMLGLTPTLAVFLWNLFVHFSPVR